MTWWVGQSGRKVRLTQNAKTTSWRTLWQSRLQSNSTFQTHVDQVSKINTFAATGHDSVSTYVEFKIVRDSDLVYLFEGSICSELRVKDLQVLNLRREIRVVAKRGGSVENWDSVECARLGGNVGSRGAKSYESGHRVGASEPGSRAKSSGDHFLALPPTQSLTTPTVDKTCRKWLPPSPLLICLPTRPFLHLASHSRPSASALSPTEVDQTTLLP